MSDHVWRQGHGIDPMREWMRRALPSSSDGMVLIDMDLAVRKYGPKYGLDGAGDLLLIEKKEYTGQVTNGERRVYDWINTAIIGSSLRSRWRGWHVLRVVYKDEPCVCEKCKQPIENDNQAYERFLNAKLYLDNKEITHAQLKAWLEKTPEPTLRERINTEIERVIDGATLRKPEEKRFP